MKRNVVGRIALFIVIALLVLSLTQLAQAQSMPPIPHAFYGKLLTSDGNPAPIGRIITAMVNGQAASQPLTTTQMGSYGGPNPDDLKLVVQGDIDNGTTIEFYVDGVRATPSEPEKAKFKSGEVTELDLSYTPLPPTPPPTPPPTAPPTGGGGVGGGGGSLPVVTPRPATPTATATVVPTVSPTPTTTSTPVITPTPTTPPTPAPQPSAKGLEWPQIVGIVIGAFVLGFLFLLLLMRIRRK